MTCLGPQAEIAPDDLAAKKQGGGTLRRHPPTPTKGRIFLELMMSDRNLKASREGSK